MCGGRVNNSGSGVCVWGPVATGTRGKEAGPIYIEVKDFVPPNFFTAISFAR